MDKNTPPKMTPRQMTAQGFIDACSTLLQKIQGAGIKNRMECQILREKTTLLPEMADGLVAQLSIWFDDGQVRHLAFGPDTVEDAHVGRIAGWIRGTIKLIDQPLNAAAVEEFNGLARAGAH